MQSYVCFYIFIIDTYFPIKINIIFSKFNYFLADLILCCL